jgi:hypothetical protein
VNFFDKYNLILPKKAMKPIEQPLTEFFNRDATQCVCYKLPTHPDGVIQELGKLGQISVTPLDFYRTLKTSEPIARINEPSNLILPIICAVGITLISKLFEDK